VWLHFETMVREVSRDEFFRLGTGGQRDCPGTARRDGRAAESRAEKVFRGAEALKALVSPEEYRNLFTLAAEVGKLTLKEVEAYMKKTQLRSEARRVAGIPGPGQGRTSQGDCDCAESSGARRFIGHHHEFDGPQSCRIEEACEGCPCPQTGQEVTAFKAAWNLVPWSPSEIGALSFLS
jgi:hypothetical protein